MRSMKQTLAGAALVAVSVASTGANAATFDYTGAVVSYTVPTSGLYDVTAAGGQGGDGGQIPVMGGAGATISGDIFLTAGARLDVVVGGRGLVSGGVFTGGGGGGSFVFAPASSLPLLVAGGGGGGGFTEPYLHEMAVGGAGQTGTAGQAGISYGAPGGIGGSGGSYGLGDFPAGGGGGWAGNGGGAGLPTVPFGPGYGGFGPPTFAGGLGPGSFPDGGFGGGGGGSYTAGGGGGGYSGGGGGYGGLDEGYGGGGGGSFVDPRFFNVVAIPGDNDGDGFVTIDAVPEPAAPAVIGAGLVALGLVRRRRPRP